MVFFWPICSIGAQPWSPMLCAGSGGLNRCLSWSLCIRRSSTLVAVLLRFMRLGKNCDLRCITTCRGFPLFRLSCFYSEGSMFAAFLAPTCALVGALVPLPTAVLLLTSHSAHYLSVSLFFPFHLHLHHSGHVWRKWGDCCGAPSDVCHPQPPAIGRPPNRA